MTKDTCDEHDKADCLKCFYTTAPADRRERIFDELLEGMRPKVSNFGAAADDEAKQKLQELFDQWWGAADAFYRKPFKDFIRSTADVEYKRGYQAGQASRDQEAYEAGSNLQ